MQRVYTRLTEFFLNLVVCSIALSCLMNALGGECLCLREISIHVYNLLTALLLTVYLFIRFFILHFVAAYYLLTPILKYLLR